MRKSSLFIIFLFVLSVTAGTTVPGPTFEEMISLRSVGSPIVSPDGKSIAFSVRTTDWAKNRYDREVWLVRDGERPFQLTRTKNGSSSMPKWSPDGRWIAFLADRGENRQIYLIRPNGGEAQKITAVKGGIDSYAWFPSGKKILFAKTDKISQSMKDREKRYGRFAVEDAEYRFTRLWTIDVTPDLWPSPEEVPCYESEESSCSEPTNTAKTQKKCVSLPEGKQLMKGADFTVTDYALSPDGKKVAFSHQVNPLRISYTTSDISILDMESGKIKLLVSNPGYDGDSLWSPDSKWILYSSAFLTTNTRRFKAISVGAGISDWMTYYVNTDIHPFTRQYLKATPWVDPKIYAKTSPIAHITKAATPTLIQHGEFDKRVPIPNAYELFQGLEDMGVPTKLIVYKGFGHGITKPKERLAATRHNWQWFAKYIWGEKAK